MPERKVIRYVLIVSAITILGVQAKLMANQSAIEKNMSDLMQHQPQPSPQLAANLEPHAGETPDPQPVEVADAQPLQSLDPQSLQALHEGQAIKPPPGKQYASAPVPYFDNGTPQAQQEATQQKIHRIRVKQTPSGQYTIPAYHPASQATAPVLNAYVPQPQYTLSAEQQAKLKQLGQPVPPQPAPVEAKPEDEAILGGSVSGTFDITSNYSFRGISQTNGKPAAQGGLEWLHSSGVYLGVWGSNVNFRDGDQAQLELDEYGGWRAEINDKLSSDIGIIHYSYPGSATQLHYDYTEAYVSGQYKQPFNMDLGGGFKTDNLKLGTSFNYSPQFFAHSGSGYYLKATAALPFSNGITLDGSLGRQWVANNVAFGYPDYMDWSLGIAYALPKDFEIKLQYIDTNIASNKCPDFCDGKVVLSLSKSF